MKVKELAEVMKDQFIAVSDSLTGRIYYSGSADKFYSYTGDKNVKSVIVPKNEDHATIIEV